MSAPGAAVDAAGKRRALRSEAEACRYIVDLIYDRCRIRLHDGKEALIKARLGKRMRLHGFPDLAAYCQFLQEGASEDEFTLVVDALTTNFTNFLREPDHFEFMVKEAAPRVIAAGQKRFRVWSAASSSGEEPYTIAMFLAEHFPIGPGWEWHVDASDISTKVLDKARLGIYPEERARTVPSAWLRKYFQRGTGKWTGHVRVKSSLANQVTFRQVNLIEPYQHAQAFDLIFCRNVMIYFDRPTQEQLVNRLCQCLAPGGHLLIGHSESLNGLKVPVRCLRPSVYQKC